MIRAAAQRVPFWLDYLPPLQCFPSEECGMQAIHLFGAVPVSHEQAVLMGSGEFLPE
jgi:hypothetical protein